jgi:hypothetical protein
MKMIVERLGFGDTDQDVELHDIENVQKKGESKIDKYTLLTTPMILTEGAKFQGYAYKYTVAMHVGDYDIDRCMY